MDIRSKSTIFDTCSCDMIFQTKRAHTTRTLHRKISSLCIVTFGKFSTYQIKKYFHILQHSRIINLTSTCRDLMTRHALIIGLKLAQEFSIIAYEQLILSHISTKSNFNHQLRGITNINTEIKTLLSFFKSLDTQC